MKAFLSIISLLIVLGIVGSLMKKQLQAMGGGSARNALAASQAGLASEAARDGVTHSIPGGMPGAVAADPNAINVPQQVQGIQQKARDDTARALQQDADRNRRAEP